MILSPDSPGQAAKSRRRNKFQAALPALPLDRCSKGTGDARRSRCVSPAMIDRVAASYRSAGVRKCAGFWTPAITTLRMLSQPASKKRQGTKSREVGHGLGSKRYGNLMSAPSSMVGGILAQLAQNRGSGLGKSMP